VGVKSSLTPVDLLLRRRRKAGMTTPTDRTDHSISARPQAALPALQRDRSAAAT
jgi:hypothetical protein